MKIKKKCMAIILALSMIISPVLVAAPAWADPIEAVRILEVSSRQGTKLQLLNQPLGTGIEVPAITDPLLVKVQIKFQQQATIPNNLEFNFELLDSSMTFDTEGLCANKTCGDVSVVKTADRIYKITLSNYENKLSNQTLQLRLSDYIKAEMKIGNFMVQSGNGAKVELGKDLGSDVEVAAYSTKLKVTFRNKDNFPEDLLLKLSLKDGYVLDVNQLKQNQEWGNSLTINKVTDEEYSIAISGIKARLKNNAVNNLRLDQYISFTKTVDEIYEDLTDEGVLAFNSYKMTGEDLKILLLHKLSELELDLVSDLSVSLNTDTNQLTISRNGVTKTYNVTYAFAGTNDALVSKVKSQIQDLKGYNYNNGEATLFALQDLELINYYYYGGVKFTGQKAAPSKEALNYSSEYKKALKYSNLEIELLGKGSDPNIEVVSTYSGNIAASYNGIITAVLPKTKMGAYLFNVIYVPDDTEKTDEAYMKAAEKRIEDYIDWDVSFAVGTMNIKGVEGQFGAVLKDTSLVDLSSSTGSTYTLYMDGTVYTFVILRDSSKMISPEVATNDILTDISIRTDSFQVPGDACIYSAEVDSKSAGGAEMLKSLNVTDGHIYDISLHSNTIGQYVSKLDDGKFNVSIPVPSGYEGKKLVVYYLKEDGEKEEHEVTVKDGYATFTTDHFSIYTLTSVSSKQQDNPSTGDHNHMWLWVLIAMSACAAGACGTVLKKKSSK